MKRPFSALALAVVMAAGLGTCAGAREARAAGRHSPFVTALLPHFDAWDLNHDGTLSGDEIDQAVLNPAVKGDAAAVAATLELLSRSNKKLKIPALTKAYFESYDATASEHVANEKDAIQQTTDTVASNSADPVHGAHGVPWDTYFVASKKRIALAAPAVFPGKVAIDKMHQGPIGDCFLVATIGSIVVHRPAVLNQVVKPLAAGGYEISFPGVAPFKMPASTEPEYALSGASSGEDAGSWLPVVEQAYGRVCSIRKGGLADVEGTDIIRRGGDSSNAIKMLTGHETRRISFGWTVAERAKKAAVVLPELREALVSAIADHRVITGGVDPHTRPASTEPGETKYVFNDGMPKIPPHISIHHVYTIVAYDRASDMVTLWNPHGNEFQPKGPDGLENGYTTKDGIFKLPLKDAYAFYTSFTFETAEPVKVASAKP